MSSAQLHTVFNPINPDKAPVVEPQLLPVETIQSIGQEATLETKIRTLQETTKKIEAENEKAPVVDMTKGTLEEKPVGKGADQITSLADTDEDKFRKEVTAHDRAQ